MSKRNPSVLFQEYLRSDSAQIRKNAIAGALSAGLESCYREILRIAVSDPEPSVREFAESQISTSGTPAPSAYIGALQETIVSGRRSLDAYRLMGRIRARGCSFPLTIPIATRINLAIHERLSNIGKVRGLSFQAFGAGLFGVVVFYLIALGVTRGADINSEAGGGMVLSWLLAACLFLISGRWWRPVQTEADRLVGIGLECCVLALWGAAEAGCAILAFSNTDPNAQHPGVGAALVAGVLSCCATRVGVAIAGGTVRSKMTCRIFQILTGTAAGVFTAAIICAGVGHARDYTPSATWLFLCPTLLALAIVFARVDSRAYDNFAGRPTFGRLNLPLTLFAVAAISLATVIVVIPAKIKPAERREDNAGNTVRQYIPVTKLPYTESLTFDSPRRLQIELQDQRIGVPAPTVRLTLQTGASPSFSLDTPIPVTAGNYQVTLSQPKAGLASAISAGAILPMIITRLRGGFRPVMPEPVECTLVLSTSPIN